MPGPQIEVDVVTHVRQQDINRAASQLRSEYQRVGEDVGRLFAKGVSAAGPQIERQQQRLIAIAEKYAAAERKIADVRKAAEQQATSLGGKEAEVARIRNDLQEATRRTTDAENRLSTSRRGAFGTTSQAIRAERDLASARADHERLSRELAIAESDVDKARSRHVSTIQRVSVEEKKLQDIHRSHISALRDLRGSYGELSQSTRGVQNDLASLGRSFSQTIAGLTPLERLGPSAMGTVGLALASVAGIAARAAESIWLIPAAAAAAGAGMGTLALATMGFSDAIKDIRDPEKFAADLQLLSPNAQQAALALQQLLPTFDQIKNATQDTFFAGIPQMINNLAQQYAPMIQQLTTGIAGAFNQAMTGIGNLLMTPQMQQTIQQTMNNIVIAFQQLAPAAVPLTQAFAELTRVGSQFLPQIAGVVTDLATRFAAFIDEASRSGDLSRWMSEGLDTLKQLGELAFILVQNFAELAPIGETVLPRINETLRLILPIVTEITNALFQFNPPMIIWKAAIDDAFRRLGLFAGIFNAIKDAINVVIIAWNTFDDKIRNSPITKILAPLASLLPQGNVPTIPNVTAPANPTLPGAPGRPPPIKWGEPPPPMGQWGRQWGAPTVPGYPAGGLPVPTPPGPPGRTLSQQDRLEAIMAGIPPEQYKVNLPPMAGMPATGGPPLPGIPGMTAPGQMTYGPQGQLGYYEQDPRKIAQQQHDLETAAHDLEEARKKRIALEQADFASQQDLEDAKWDEHQKEWKLNQSQQDLVEAQQGTFKKAADALSRSHQDMQQLGAKIDQDFGISQGLPGIADNLTKFLANLAMAPVLGRLGLTSQLGGGQEAGSGLMSMLANQGVFGPGYTPQARALEQALRGGQPGMPGMQMPDVQMPPGVQMPGARGMSYGLPAGTNISQGAPGFPDWVYKLGAAFNLKPSTYAGHQETQRPDIGAAPNPQGLNRGIDWFGSPEDMNRFAQYLMSSGLAEQVIHMDPRTGQKFGYPGNVDYSGNYGEETTMVHTRFGQAPMVPGLTATQSWFGNQTAGQTAATPQGLTGPQAAAYQAMTNAGWAPSEWSALSSILGRESSGGDPTAVNPRSGAFGMFQFLGHENDKYGQLGAYSPDPAAQSTAGMAYIKDRYGSPSAAWQFWQQNGWYGAGGAVPIIAHGGEHVLTTADVAAMGGQNAVYAFRAALHQEGGKVLDQQHRPGGPPGPTFIGGAAPPAGTGPGSSIGGGILGAAESAAASSLDIVAPGASIAANIGIQEINRAIEQAGQVAGIAVNGLMETFLPTGASQLAANNWITRIAGGLAGARPVLPNLAGQSASVAAAAQTAPPVRGEHFGSGLPPGPPPGAPTTQNGVYIENYNVTQSEDRAGQDLSRYTMVPGSR